MCLMFKISVKCYLGKWHFHWVFCMYKTRTGCGSIHPRWCLALLRCQGNSLSKPARKADGKTTGKCHGGGFKFYSQSWRQLRPRALKLTDITRLWIVVLISVSKSNCCVCGFVFILVRVNFFHYRVFFISMASCVHLSAGGVLFQVGYLETNQC